MKRIRIIQIGIAHAHATAVLRGLGRLPDLYELVGYVIPESERAEYEERKSYLGNAREYTLEEALADPTVDAFTIETAERDLSKYALAAVRAGKHVHMDKPGGFSLTEFEELIRTAKEKRSVLHFGYMYRYNPEIKKLIARVKSGELGEIFSVDAEMSCAHKERDRLALREMPGGMMFFLGCHLIDLILSIMGSPEQIIPCNTSTKIGGVDVTDYGFAVFKYPRGLATARTADVELGGFARRRLVVSGRLGTVELRPLEFYEERNMLYTVRTEYSSPDWGDTGMSERSEVYDRYDGMLTAFAKMVRGEMENPYTYDYELELYRTVLRAAGSI
ncbi:MAG: Gfo/Idh/MocA family oxidoreductase [Clostridia bacterium]|nr:Gfo/Idh/MocA family oxidoreductase [Clostridia bacterium]